MRRQAGLQARAAERRARLEQVGRRARQVEEELREVARQRATAEADLALFRESNVGLWSFDPATDTIRDLFTPRCSGPRSPGAKDQALESLGRSLQFSQLRKQSQPVRQRSIPDFMDSLG